MDFEPSARSRELAERLIAFMDAHVYPNETRYHEEIARDRWGHPPVLEELKAKARVEGLWNLFLPESEHGAGLTNVEYAPLCEIMGRVHFSSQVFNCSAPDTGNIETLIRYGTEAQKDHYLPRLAKGIEMPCFALTGPEAGSDAASIPDVGIVCKGMHEGQEVLGLRVTWDKRYITLGPIATLLGLAFKVRDPDRLLGGEVERGITLALIPADHPGVNIGRRHFPLNGSFMKTMGRSPWSPDFWGARPGRSDVEWMSSSFRARRSHLRAVRMERANTTKTTTKTTTAKTTTTRTEIDQ